MTLSSSKRNRQHVSDDGDEESVAGPSTPKRARPSPEASGTVTLDPEGDAIFAIKNSASDPEGTIKFLVSSKVLSLASPVFGKMFSPHFQEGTRVRNGERPCIDLEEDDPTAMDIILRILHFQSDGISSDLSRAEFASIAIHSDKYDCRRALRGWVRGWWHDNEFKFMFHLTSEEIALTLLAAHMFRFQSLPELAATAARYLKQDFLTEWEQHETLSLLPETLTRALHIQVGEGLDCLQGVLQHVEDYLQRAGKGYLVPSSQECPPCGKLFADHDGKCSCGRTLVNRYCTTHSRVAEYLNMLRTAGLYPFIEPFRTSSIQQIADVISQTFESESIHHTCEGCLQCPLVGALGGLWEGVDNVILAIQTNQLGLWGRKGGDMNVWD